MTEWCLEHPWMTLFIVVTSVEAFARCVRIRIGKRREP